MNKFVFIFTFLICAPAWAYAPNEFFFDPHFAVGFNSAQGTHLMGGVDLGYGLSELLAIGVGGYYAAGEHPADDREMGAGPFVAYTQPLTSFLLGHVRQELNYVDLYKPLYLDGTVTGHTREMGTASVTTAGIHLFFTPNFGFAVGYRLVVALSNSDLDDGRSGVYLGFSIGI